MRARPTVRGLVNGAAVLVAAAVAVSVPAAYHAVGLAGTSEALAFKARLNADKVAKYIFLHERMWRYQHVRLAELIELPEDGGPPVRQRITDAGSGAVYEQPGDVAWPAHRARAPVLVGGRVAGWLEAETSLQPQLVRTARVAAFSGMLGFAAWLAVRLLPLRALDRALAKLTAERARFGAALDNMTQGLCLFDAQDRLVVHNRRFAEMFGAPAPGATAAALGADRRLGALFGPPPPGGRDGEAGSGAHELPDGRAVRVQRRSIPGGGWVATFEDVTDRVRARDRLAHMARHDALTGLPNRAAFRERLEDALARARDSGQVAAVLHLDLDGFKHVNDTMGHAAGDELLCAVARSLKGCTGGADLVARLGGDEFAILQAASRVPARQRADAAALAGRLVQALGAPFEVQGRSVRVGASVGVALSADGAEAANADALLRGADVALRRAKAAGRGVWRSFEPGMDAELQARRALEADLRRAVAEEQFEVFYQPLVEARTGALAGFEALVRWRHPERGLVSPAEFIPAAEEMGLIGAMGAWVLHRACADAAGWPAHVKVAVNLSAAQFAGGDLTRDVERAMAASGLAPERLELEITESVLLHDNDATLAVLHRLRGMGPRVSMDDFGTGYSSLSYLRRFPFDKIKIDRCFVRDLAWEKGSMEIVRAVVGLGRALGMAVLAEGVETQAQLETLRAEGCDELQGYLFSSPRPLREVPGIIARHAAATGRTAAYSDAKQPLVPTQAGR